MPSYPQWRASADKSQVAKVMWVCGDQRVLVEEVIEETRRILDVSEFDYISLWAESDNELSIWDAAYQFPLEPDAKRLILVRQADHVKNWNPLEKWLTDSKNLAANYLMFVSDESDYPVTQDKDPILLPHVELIRKKGKTVKCSMPSQAEVLAWIKRNSRLNDFSANFLYERCGSDLYAVANVCKKSLMFKADPGSQVLAELSKEYAGQNFTDCLIYQNKKAALLDLPNIPESDYSKIIGQLYAKLDTLYALHRAGPNFSTTRELSEATGIKMFLITKYLQSSKSYDRAKVTNCKNILTVVDDAVQRHATEGSMELLVSLW